MKGLFLDAFVYRKGANNVFSVYISLPAIVQGQSEQLPFICTLTSSYRCDKYTMTGRETGSDTPGCAKTAANGLSGASTSAAVTPVVGRIAMIPVTYHGTSARKGAALKQGKMHHLHLRKNGGRLLWCP